MLSMHIVQDNYNPELEHNIQNICTSLTGYPCLITDVHLLQKNYFKKIMMVYIKLLTNFHSHTFCYDVNLAF